MSDTGWVVVHGYKKKKTRSFCVNGKHVEFNPVVYTEENLQRYEPFLPDYRGLNTTNNYRQHDGTNGTTHNVKKRIMISWASENAVGYWLRQVFGDANVKGPNFKRDHKCNSDLQILTSYGVIHVEVKSVEAHNSETRGYVTQVSKNTHPNMFKKNGRYPFILNPMFRRNNQRGGWTMYCCVKYRVQKGQKGRTYRFVPDVVFGQFACHLNWSDPNDPGRLGQKMTIRNDLNRIGIVPTVNFVLEKNLTPEERPCVIDFREPEQPFRLKLFLNNFTRNMTHRCSKYYFTNDPREIFSYYNEEEGGKSHQRSIRRNSRRHYCRY